MVPLGTSAGGQRGHRATRGLGQLQRVSGENDLARGHPRHVEEVIDEMGEMRILARDDLAGAARGFGGRVWDVEHVGGVGDGGERIAQLVAEHGEQLILAPAGRFRLRPGGVLGGQQSRLLHGHRRMVGQRHSAPSSSGENGRRVKLLA